jgi:hypothetical protein
MLVLPNHSTAGVSVHICNPFSFLP